MKSRSYSAVASSSLLLLSISCLVPKDDKHEDVTQVSIVDASMDEGKADDGFEEPHGDKQSGHEIENSGAQDETGGEEAVPPHRDGCGADEMLFEGECRPKEKVKKVLDEREREALEKYHKAAKLQQAAEAAHELLEQQVAQVEKAEDDLDEILEILREEQKREGAEKGGP
jgi:hypothetical protein